MIGTEDGNGAPTASGYGPLSSAGPGVRTGAGPLPNVEQPRARTDEELADRLYDPAKMYAGALKSDVEKLRDRTGMTETEATAYVAKASAVFSDARIAPPEASQLHGLLMHFTANPPDDATLAGWTEQSRRELRQTFGPDADARMQAVREFLSRYPDLSKLLAESGVGSHPRLVMRLAEGARHFRPKGK